LRIADVQSCEDVAAALAFIRDRRTPADVLICGSLYLAGAVLDLNDEIPV